MGSAPFPIVWLRFDEMMIMTAPMTGRTMFVLRFRFNRHVVTALINEHNQRDDNFKKHVKIIKYQSIKSEDQPMLLDKRFKRKILDTIKMRVVSSGARQPNAHSPVVTEQISG